MNKNKFQVPSHRTFRFGNITISSDFDSGNCVSAEKNSGNNFDLWLNGDHSKNNYRVWFYFSIEGISQSSTVGFTIKNMQNQSRLVNDGLLPVYREQGKSQWHKIKSIKNDTSYFELYQGNMQWTFKHTFKNTNKHYFALFFPWSNEDNNQFLKDIAIKAKNIPNLYFYWAPITKTIEERPVDFLVISSASGKDDKQVVIQDKNIFNFVEKPASFFNSKKKCIVISARVHPGEVPSSHVMSGIIQTLVSDTQMTKVLLDNFVFYLFPILNPDGVGRGHYRVDTNGINLNRCYINPSPQAHPTIYSLRSIINYIHQNDKFFAFLDLHAHPAPRGNFLYGNSSSELVKQLQCCLFPKILSMNTSMFDYQGSNFTEENMYSKDRGDHISKQGSGRVAMYRLTKNPQCWTLECGYNKSRFQNILECPRKIQTQQNKKEQQQKNELENIDNLYKPSIINYYQAKTSPLEKQFTINTYRQLGHSICQSFLDLIHKNPFSRIQNPEGYFQSLNNFKLNLAISLLRQSPNRYESYFSKIYYGIHKGDNKALKTNSLKALYYMLIKKAKIVNITSYIKNGDISDVVIPSPKKRISPKKINIQQQQNISQHKKIILYNSSDVFLNHEKTGFSNKYQYCYNTEYPLNYNQDENDQTNKIQQQRFYQQNAQIKGRYQKKTNHTNYFYDRVFNNQQEHFIGNSNSQKFQNFQNWDKNHNFIVQRSFGCDYKSKSLKNKVSIKVQEFKLQGIKHKNLVRISSPTKQTIGNKRANRIQSEKKKKTQNRKLRAQIHESKQFSQKKQHQISEQQCDIKKNKVTSQTLKSGKLSSKTIITSEKKHKSDRIPSNQCKNLLKKIKNHKGNLQIKAFSKNHKSILSKKKNYMTLTKFPIQK